MSTEYRGGGGQEACGACESNVPEKCDDKDEIFILDIFFIF